MCDKSNKKFWDKFAKRYAAFMKKDKGVYDKVCGYIRPYLNKEMNVLELACVVSSFKAHEKLDWNRLFRTDDSGSEETWRIRKPYI